MNHLEDMNRLGGPTDTTAHLATLAGVAAFGKEVFYRLSGAIAPEEASDSTGFVQAVAEMNSLPIDSSAAAAAAGTVATIGFLNSARTAEAQVHDSPHITERLQDGRGVKTAKWLGTAVAAATTYKVAEGAPEAVAWSTALAPALIANWTRNIAHSRARRSIIGSSAR